MSVVTLEELRKARAILEVGKMVAKMKVVWCFKELPVIARFLKPSEFECVFPKVGDEAEMTELLKDADFLVVRRKPVVTKKIIDSARKLKLIQRVGTKVENIDLEAAKSAKIPVAFMPWVSDLAVAEHAIMFMLALSKDLISSHSFVAKAGYRKVGKKPAPTTEETYPPNWMGMKNLKFLCGKTLGLIGMGEIGQEVAKRANAFEMNVVYHKRHQLPSQQESELRIRYLPLEELLSASDYVSLHIPHTKATERMIGRKELDMMKPTAFLINTSRGGVIDEEALREALARGAIAGAGLDVFAEEPVSEGNPILTAPNIMLTPHIAGWMPTDEKDLERSIAPICENILRVAKGEKAINLVC